MSVGEVLGVAALFPAARIVLGGARAGEIRGASRALARLPNVSLETSQAESMDALRSLIDVVGAKRVLFGTHTPLYITRSALLKLEEARLEPEAAAAVSELNARRLIESAKR